MSRREDVGQALLALVKAALPNADVARNRAKPQTTGPGGTVILRDGDPGDPEVTLSPLTYHYDHPFGLDVAPYVHATKTPEVVLDEMMTAIGAAVAADRRLGGLCDWLDCVAPEIAEFDVAGSAEGRSAFPAIVASYSTPSPL